MTPTDEPGASRDALRAGDPVAVEEALVAVLPTVRKALYRLLGPRALPAFEGRSSLTTFAYKIAVRVAWRHFSPPSTVPLELLETPASGDDPEARTDDREALRRLYRCLSKLPENRRAAFLLCDVEGMTPSEAAETLGTSSLALRSRLLHARLQVRKLAQRDPYLARWFERDAP